MRTRSQYRVTTPGMSTDHVIPEIQSTLIMSLGTEVEAVRCEVRKSLAPHPVKDIRV